MFTIEPPACAADELGQVGAVYKSRRAEKGRFYPVAYTSTHTRISLPPDGLPAASRLTISYCCLCAKSNRKQTLRNHKEYTHKKWIAIKDDDRASTTNQMEAFRWATIRLSERPSYLPHLFGRWASFSRPTRLLHKRHLQVSLSSILWCLSIVQSGRMSQLPALPSCWISCCPLWSPNLAQNQNEPLGSAALETHITNHFTSSSSLSAVELPNRLDECTAIKNLKDQLIHFFF